MNRTRWALMSLVLPGLFIVAGCNGNEMAADGGGWDVGVDPHFIYDDQGRVLILHGANVTGSAKGDPLRMPWITKDDAMRLSRDWGFNFARYLILWDGLEAQQGVYDQAYLDRIKERLDWLWAAGIYVMLDMHQDVWSVHTCGDGAPQWAVRSDGLEIQCPQQWFLGYFQPGVARCFDNFWNYQDPNADLQDHYATAWTTIAARFRDHPAVIGYDIINEPHPGSMVDALELLGVEHPDTPSPEFDRKKLGPFYQRMIDRIRQVDAGKWIFYEPRYGAPGDGLPSYMNQLVDPRPGGRRLAYSPHLYSLQVESSQAYDPATDQTIPKWEQRRRQEMGKLDSALVIGEWGTVQTYTNALGHFRDVANMADRMMAGWAYWTYDPGGFGFINGDGSEREGARELVRVYPQRIAGTPRSFAYDPATRVFRLEFAGNPAVTAPTEIYIPARRFYPNGWDLTVKTDAKSWSKSWDETREVVSVTISPPAGTCIIEVKPKE